MSLHTSGPWGMRLPGDDSKIIRSKDALVCKVYAQANRLTEVANTSLIVAAPELLAALETLYALVASDFDSSEAGKDDPTLLALAKAQAALCKATGGCE